MNNQLTVIDGQEVRLMEGYSSQEMHAVLQEMKQKLNLTQQFFKEVMIEGQDYGVLEGTAKPTLLKAGAEKLCELYGFSPIVKMIEETAERDTGYYRARVTISLIHRRSGVTIADGVGEANTMESRYRWRWVFENELPRGIDKNSLVQKSFPKKNGNGTYIKYRIENEDLHSLWNTVLKMAKKRGLIDAVLSATRSSGIFTQDVEDLKDWAEAAPSDEPNPRRENGTPAYNRNESRRTSNRPQGQEGKHSPQNQSGAHKEHAAITPSDTPRWITGTVTDVQGTAINDTPCFILFLHNGSKVLIPEDHPVAQQDLNNLMAGQLLKFLTRTMGDFEAIAGRSGQEIQEVRSA